MKTNKRQKAVEIRKFLLDMIADARKEARDLTDEEQKLFDEQKSELIALAEEINKTSDKLDEIEAELPDIEDKADEPDEEKPEEPAEEPEKPAEEPAEEPVDEPKEEPEEKADEPEKEPDEKPAEEPENQPDETPINTEEEEKNLDENENENKKRNIMQNFSFIKAIRSIVNNERPDDYTAAVLEAGKKSFRDAGLGYTGNLQIPFEKRTFTVTTAHDDVVESEFDSLLTPLYANRVLSKARIYSDLHGDLVLPILEAGEEARWESEISTNKEITNGTDSLKLTPHRLSVSTKISKQMLAQDSLGVENAIREDLLNNLYNKLEKTFLSADAASGNVPAGIFAGKTATLVQNFKGICELEASIEEKNYNGALEYVFSPAAKAEFRQMTFGGGRTQRMVMEGNEIDGVPFSTTTNVAKNYFGLLDWSSVRLAQWAGIDLVVDPYTGARDNVIILTLNSFWDCKVARPELVAYGTTVAPTNNPG